MLLPWRSGKTRQHIEHATHPASSGKFITFTLINLVKLPKGLEVSVTFAPYRRLNYYGQVSSIWEEHLVSPSGITANRVPGKQDTSTSMANRAPLQEHLYSFRRTDSTICQGAVRSSRSKDRASCRLSRAREACRRAQASSSEAARRHVSPLRGSLHP